MDLPVGPNRNDAEPFDGPRNLNGDAYKAITVVYPPFPEQQRIVAILDEAFEGPATAKANAEKNLLNARELLTAHLESSFSQQNDLVPLSGCATFSGAL